MFNFLFLGGTILIGTDATESMSFKLIKDNNIYINLEPNRLTETQDLFNKLSEGGKVELPLKKEF